MRHIYEEQHMKSIIKATTAAFLAFSVQAALAHDPAEHAKEAAAANAAPDCAKMKDMDMSKMDMNDPVVQAMHKKCMGDGKSMDMKGMHDMKGMDMKGMHDMSGMKMESGASDMGAMPKDAKAKPAVKDAAKAKSAVKPQAPAAAAPAEAEHSHDHGTN